MFSWGQPESRRLTVWTTGFSINIPEKVWMLEKQKERSATQDALAIFLYGRTDGRSAGLGWEKWWGAPALSLSRGAQTTTNPTTDIIKNRYPKLAFFVFFFAISLTVSCAYFCQVKSNEFPTVGPLHSYTALDCTKSMKNPSGASIHCCKSKNDAPCFYAQRLLVYHREWRHSREQTAPSH